MSLHERIRSVGIRLGAMAGRVNPDDWREISTMRDELATCANETEWLENLRDAAMAEEDGSVASNVSAVEAQPEEAAQPATSDKKRGKTAKEGT